VENRWLSGLISQFLAVRKYSNANNVDISGIPNFPQTFLVKSGLGASTKEPTPDLHDP
jgi:hypothetical protein